MTSEKTSSLKSASVTLLPLGLKLADIKEQILTCFRKDEYKQLRSYLRDHRFTKGQFAYFFLQEESSVVLTWALNSIDNKALKFLIETVPTLAIITALNKNEYQALKSFLQAQAGFERMRWYTPKIKEAQISKFKALLSINKGSMENFMTENASLCTKELQDSFRTALSQFTEEQTAGELQCTPVADAITQKKKPAQASTQPAHEVSSSSSSSTGSPTQGAGFFGALPTTRGRRKRRRSVEDVGEKTDAQGSSPSLK
jgi:Tfp pilus assembly protein PilE